MLYNFKTNKGYVQVLETKNSKNATRFWVTYFIEGEKGKVGTTYIGRVKNHYYNTFEQAMKKAEKVSKVF